MWDLQSFSMGPSAPWYDNDPLLPEWDPSGFGPRDLAEPAWGKMSGVPGPTTKKRKKTDAKPQSQINKCLNEKRRREQENIYIEELAELISASFADMNSLSVKPDKCAILQETVNQIRHIKQQEHCGGDAAVQQGEVSSSNPTVLRNEVFGPLLLEALDGFLFVVNQEGKIEFVTENVHQFIKYTRDDVFGKSIYNFIHHGDHARFSSSLLPMSIGWSPEPSPQNSRKTFECRLLVKPPDDQDSTMEEKQQRVSKYENMQIQCTQVQLNKDKGDLGDADDVSSESGDVGLSLMCVARRIPQNEKAVGTPIEQFSMKLDTSGKIVGIDTFGVSAAYSQYLNKELMGKIIQEMCHPQDLQKLSVHLKETLTVGTATSSVYRLRVGSPDKFVRVKTVSKLFKTNISLQEPDFIMATHSIIGELDVSSPESGVTSPPSSTSVGGPLMSGSNGGMPLGPQTGGGAQPFSSYELSLHEFDFFPSSTWDVTEGGGDSRASLTPRPPSVPVYSPAPAHAFPFSPLQEEEKEAREEPQESGRLRNLLTQRGSVDEDDSEARNKHRILKGLLNQEEEEEVARPSNGRLPTAQTPPNNNNNNNNNMLLKLLNEKSDDDDLESRAGLKKQNELLQQLLKEQNEDRKPTTMNSQQEDNLLKSLGFRNSSPSPPTGDGMSSLIGNRKRPSDEADGSGGPGGKRPPDSGSSGQVSSTGNSKLWEKNKMLASLLAKEPPKATTIPPIPTSVISATPQDKLPKIGDRLKAPGGPWSGGNVQGGGGVNQMGGAPGRPPGPPSAGKPTQRTPGSQFLTHILAHQQDPQLLTLAKHLQERATQNNLNQVWDSQSSDPVLSDLLDQVIDIVPDAVCSDSSQIINLLEHMDQVQPPNQTCYQQDQLQERMAINAIQKSLMLCETAVKSPSSPSAYSSPPSQPAGFPPPPVYQLQTQRARFAGNARPPFTVAQQQQQALLHRKLQEQQKQQLQQKQRLLQAQQQQQLLIPSNAAADPAALSNIDSLLNNTVAPNVSLQRSASVPEAQLSPGYSNQMLSNGGPISSPRQQQQQQPYSPHSPQGWGQPTQARLSPHPQSQLSPRITQGQQPGYPVTSQGQPSAQSAASWQQNNRLSMQQQQNPMLNAQLTGGYGGNSGGRFPSQARAGQPGRTLASPGPGPRQSPFPPEAFPPPASPTGYQPSGPQFSPQQQQQMRLQRSISTPTATTQLPGGPVAPRHYGHGKEMPRPHHMSYPSFPSHPSPEHMLYHPMPHQPSDLQYYEQMYARPPPLQSAEYVRQELRAVVGARTQQLAPPASPRQHIQQVSAADLEALGLSFEMPSGPSESPKMWGSMGADLGASSPQSGLSNRSSSMEDTQRAGEQKSSLLQKLLSE